MSESDLNPFGRMTQKEHYALEEIRRSIDMASSLLTPLEYRNVLQVLNNDVGYRVSWLTHELQASAIVPPPSESPESKEILP